MFIAFVSSSVIVAGWLAHVHVMSDHEVTRSNYVDPLYFYRFCLYFGKDVWKGYKL